MTRRTRERAIVLAGIKRTCRKAERLMLRAEANQEILKKALNSDRYDEKTRYLLYSDLKAERDLQNNLSLGLVELQKHYDEECSKEIFVEMDTYNPSVADVKSIPHPLTEIITRIVTKPKIANRVIDARAEVFERLAKDSVTSAHLFCWLDTLKSLWPSLKALGRWAMVGELFRRWLGS